LDSIWRIGTLVGLAGYTKSDAREIFAVGLAASVSV
jgi:hypothetical protein